MTDEDRDLQSWMAEEQAKHPDPLDLKFVFPDWVPQLYREMYRGSLTRLIKSGISQDAIGAAVESYRESWERAQARARTDGPKAIEQWRWAPGMPPANFNDAKAVAHLIWCLDIGREDVTAGLWALSGPNAAGVADLVRGQATLNSASKGGVARQKLRAQETETNRTRRCEVLRELKHNHPRLSDRRISQMAAEKLAREGDSVPASTLRDQFLKPGSPYKDDLNLGD